MKDYTAVWTIFSVFKMTSYEMSREKLEKIIAFDNFKFRFHKNLANNVDKFRCCVNFCEIYIKVDDSGEILLYPGQHDHDSYTDAELTRHEVSNAVKRKKMGTTFVKNRRKLSVIISRTTVIWNVT